MSDPLFPENDPRATDSTREPDAPDAYALRVGTTIKGKWHVDALLGVGGMAAVYAASHRNGQRAALKILHIELAKDKQVCERFLREAYVSNKIGHPACVKVLDDDVTEAEEPFLVMELLEGETLRDLWMRTGRRMPVIRVLEIADPILDCLAACHVIGVIHRDLKPANIFVCADHTVKVLDFGVAQFRSATTERTATGTTLGTPSYMSPEQAMGLVDQLDGRTDFFSVGAILHALVSGHRINKGRTENEALVMAATTPVPSLARIAPDLPLEIISLVDKALAWDCRNRFESARSMQEAVRLSLAAVSGRPPSLAPGPATPPPARPSSRPPSSHDDIGLPRAPLPSRPPVLTDAAAPDDPRVAELRDLFRRIDRVLPTVRQLGWDHPATERALRTAFEAFAEALRANPDAVDFAVRPYSFMRLGQAVWEPASPFDGVPYNLFACGIRAMRVDPGLTLDEMRELFALLILEPGRDLPPEDDLATALWEKALPHVTWDVVDALAEGDAAEREAFWGESDRLEKAAAQAARANASRLEAKAMAVSTDCAALAHERCASPMALDDVVRAVYASQLEHSHEKWSERYVDVAVEGLIDAAKNRDAQLVLASFRRSAADLVVAGRVDVVTTLHGAMQDRLRERLAAPQSKKLGDALTNALFGAETLALMLKKLHDEPSRAAAFEPVLLALSEKELPAILAAMREPMPDEVLTVLLRYVERVMPGREAEIARAASGLDAAVAAALVALLPKSSGPASRQVLFDLAQSDDPKVRVEAKMQLAGKNPEAMGVELSAMVEDVSPPVRLAALRAVARYGVKGAWPAVARRVKGHDFPALSSDERAELLRALLQLSPERGEPIALEIVKKAGVFVSEEREASRLAAIDALATCSRSTVVATALREVSQARWGTSDETRAAAATAADQVAQRGSSGVLS